MWWPGCCWVVRDGGGVSWLLLSRGAETVMLALGLALLVLGPALGLAEPSNH